jgi:hypothetical protein
MSPPVSVLKVDINFIDLCSKFVFYIDKENFSSRYECIWVVVRTALNACLRRIYMNSLQTEFGKCAYKM